MKVKRALVTGAGKRLGRAMALRLGEMGFDVAVHYATSADGAREVAERIRAGGGRAEALQADLLDEEQRQNLVGRAAEALGGPLSLLVNNASIFEYDNLESATADSWERHLGSNLRAPFVLTQRFAAQAPGPAKDAGSEPVAQSMVVNMLDQRVLKPTPEFMSYTIAKMGLWAFTRTAAQALGARVRVNAIGPGPTLIGANQSRENYARQRTSTVLGRGADPGDVADALAYLIGAKAVTGQLICVDGGQHLGWQTPDVLGLE